MNSPRTTWVWRVAGLAVALMLGFAARRITTQRTPEPPVVAPEPGGSGPPQTSRTTDSEPAPQDHPSRITPPTDEAGSRFTFHVSTATDHEPLTTDHTLLTTAYETARTDPGRALELAADLPPGQDRNDLLSHVATEWAAKAPEAAAEWASQLNDPALREPVMAGIAAAWAERNPTAAAEWAIESLGPGKLRDDAVMSIVQRWAQQTPSEAAGWVVAFPAGALRDTAVEELVKLWTDQNVEAAGQWLGGLSLGSIRDTAVGAYVNKIVLQFPESAARWAKDIQDETLRARELETVGEFWMASNPAAARPWITQAPFPAATRTKLLALKSD